jgi:hypothetical protein
MAGRAPQIYNSALDANQDGQLTNSELNAFVMKAQMKELEGDLMKRIIRVLLVMLGVLFVALILLIFGIVEATKEVKTDGSKMVNPSSGETLQCASADFTITNGVLATRDSNSADSSLILSGQRSLQDLNPDIIDALAVRNYYKQVKLHSSLPEKYFRELLWLNIESTTASTLSLKVFSIIRIPHNKAKCGSFLKLTTANGVLMLDDTSIFYDHDIFDLFAESGFDQYVGQESSGRRVLHHLSADHHKEEAKRGFRRLASNDLSLVGFFNSIDSYEWGCASVEMPSMPSSYSADLTYYIPCLDPTNGITENLCTIRIDDTGKPRTPFLCSVLISLSLPPSQMRSPCLASPQETGCNIT